MNTYAKSLAEFNKTFEPKVDYLHLIMEEFNEWFIEQDSNGKPEDELKELCDLLYVVYGYADSNKLGEIQPNDSEINKMIKDGGEYVKRFPKQKIWPTFVATAYLYFITSKDFMWLYRLAQGTFAYGRHKGWPIEHCFKEVHKSNMSKVGADGKPIRREDGKIMKGPNYKAPDLKSILEKKNDIKPKSKRITRKT